MSMQMGLLFMSQINTSWEAFIWLHSLSQQQCLKTIIQTIQLVQCISNEFTVMGSYGALQNQITLPGFFPSPLPDKWPWRTNFSYLSERNALYLMLNKQYWVMAEHAVLPWTFEPHFSDQSFARVHVQKEPAWYGLDDVCIPSADAFDDCPNCKSKWAQSVQYWTRESSTCKKETRLDWA